MSQSTPVPTSVTCFKNGLSHLTFPINFRPGLSPIKIGPLTPETVNGSVSVIPDPDNTKLKIYSITGENNLMIKVHYKLDDQDEKDSEKGSFSYICPGIKWTPNYLIKINQDEKKLSI